MKVAVKSGQALTNTMWRAEQKARFLRAFVPKHVRVATGTSDWGNLRLWSRMICSVPWVRNPGQLARMVSRHDPDLGLATLKEAWVIRGDGGRMNLNAHRIGTLDGVRVFEKIYLLGSEAWRRTNWAYSGILPNLNEWPRTPRLVHQVQGQRLAAAYFEYLPDVKKGSVAVTLDAAKTFRKQVAHLDMSGIDPALTDFRSDPLYVQGATLLRAIISAAGRNPSQVDRVEASFISADTARVLTHSDLSTGNVTSDGTILDWDGCGAYPLGYEFGKTIGGLVPCKDMADFEAAVAGEIAQACAGSSGSLEFFAAVFYARRFPVTVSDDLVLALFERALTLRGIPGDQRRMA